ncbi:YpjP family protein [Niallia sp. XMNu-256]|uniref:YpjP family protein n=1 Tax=Niallia sp. XMNu-256 TaxID=3082444 RepID=UPI0030D5B81D
MPKWIRKSLLVLVSVLTFGLVTPQDLSAHFPDEEKQPKRDLYQSKPSPVEEQTIFESGPISDNDLISEKARFVQEMVKYAEETSFMKFGSRIKPVIEDEFKELILPNIEKVISKMAEQYPEEDLSQLVISEMPSGGTSERIFHIKNIGTNKDVIRFHVRRDHPPMEGYVFNFHYHLANDGFQLHHELGVIYWDKNTPPQWMT